MAERPRSEGAASLGPARLHRRRDRRGRGRLGFALPAELVAFLRATNGFYDHEGEYGYAWSLDEIVEQNLWAWRAEPAELPRDLLAVGGAGAGGWFCVALEPENHGRVVQLERDRRRGEGG